MKGPPETAQEYNTEEEIREYVIESAREENSDVVKCGGWLAYPLKSGGIEVYKIDEVVEE